MQPLITVITVTYNAAKAIDKTLKSLKNQTFRDFEYLVIDGCSKDSTCDIIRNANIEQCILISEPDKGLYDAMNKALALAKGKYVIFLNAGDTFHDKDSLLHYAKEAAKERDIIYGDTIIVDSHGKKFADRHLKAPSSLTKDSFSNGMLICHQAFMVRKELAPRYDLSYRFSADYDWCVKCINNSDSSQCVNLNEVTVDYLNDGLTDNNKLKSLRERFNIMVSHYGWWKTVSKHIEFIFRAIKRGRI